MSVTRRKASDALNPARGCGQKIEDLSVRGVDAVDWGVITPDNIGKFKPGLSGKMRLPVEQQTLGIISKIGDAIADLAQANGFERYPVRFALGEHIKNPIDHGGADMELTYAIGAECKTRISNTQSKLFNPLIYSLMPVLQRYVLGGTADGQTHAHTGTMELLGRGVCLKYKWELGGGRNESITLDVAATPPSLEQKDALPGPGCVALESSPGSPRDNYKFYLEDRLDGSQILTSEEGFQVAVVCMKKTPPGERRLDFREFMAGFKAQVPADKFSITSVFKKK
jgi:hypothetical protein